MTELERAARQALAALEDLGGFRHDIDAAIGALREVLGHSGQDIDPAARKGWVIQDVLFESGVPVEYREPQSNVLVQEPVLIVEKEPDYMSGGHYYKGLRPHIDPTKVLELPIGTKLYTTPQTTRRALTGDEMHAVISDWSSRNSSYLDLCRDIERTHGISGVQHGE